MRHKKKINHLSRKRGHRHAMLANMASSLIVHKRIQTTTAKAKALKIYIEPLITKAKDDTTHSRRQVFSYLKDKEATAELFREVAVKIAERPGGYTRIIKLGNRQGDNADMCIMELVDYNENLLAEKASEKKSTSRRRRGGKKKANAPQTSPKTESTNVDGVTEEGMKAVADDQGVSEAEVIEENPATEDISEDTEAKGALEEKEEAAAPQAEDKEEKPISEAEESGEKEDPSSETKSDNEDEKKKD